MKKGGKGKKAATGALVRVLLIEGKDLASKDSKGKSDPFVKVNIGKKFQGKSRVQKKTVNPQWEETWEFYPVDLKKEARNDTLVQILVVVANIQMRTLKTEVEKGSM
eukprot:TRINITY_DN1031_c0_g1_i2.p1 TRINITY_DN1031_c0_g1~~TRINITY_DN1031_c0_g1_i2.p1  ORF type:complete len:119 (-),score=34.52 TRINITY_DN1031_c0_g1_i2:45-365(-)